MSLDVRLITADEVAAWGAAKNAGFLRAMDEKDHDPVRQGILFDRTLAGFDGSRLVATLRSFPSEITLPGGRSVAADAVTGVTTAATHRRRGLASRMVTADLAAAKERGESCAILIAAEWAIYGRFGYGPATEHQVLTVQTSATMIDPPGPQQGTVEFVDKATSRELVPAIHDAHRSRNAGEIVRDDRMWDFRYGLVDYPGRPEPKPQFHALARDPQGRPIGLVRYEAEGREVNRLADSTLVVQEMTAATADAERLLWHFLMSVDWVTTIRAGDRPVDELLPWWLVNARQAIPSERSDLLWLRPLDLPALLTGRSYHGSGSVVLQVADPLGFVDGRFLLEVSPDGASCTPTDRSADLTIGPAVLGSVLLGGYSLAVQHAAGQVDEHRSGAVDAADALLRTPRRPWCSTWF